MRILVVGGTRFIGPRVCDQLLALGHNVCVFHRGQTKPQLSSSVDQIYGDLRDLPNFASQFAKFAPEVVVDMICYNQREASDLIQVFSNVAARIVVISSMDVYRAYGGLLRLEEAPVDQLPLNEEYPLRESRFPYRAHASGPDDMAFNYEKILVEEAVMNAAELPGTVLRLPAVYGPGDYRTFDYLKRMIDGRSSILLEEDHASWRWTRGYVENISAAITLAVVDSRSAGRVYNVGEPKALTEQEWVRSIGRAAEWQGDVVVLRKDSMPAHLMVPYDFSHHLYASSERIRNELGYQEPVSLTDAMERTVDWERQHPPALVDPNRFDYAAEDAALALIRTT
jgi:nucleoside-diphosphate-sugar epimerase